MLQGLSVSCLVVGPQEGGHKAVSRFAYLPTFRSGIGQGRPGIGPTAVVSVGWVNFLLSSNKSIHSNKHTYYLIDSVSSIQ